MASTAGYRRSSRLQRRHEDLAVQEIVDESLLDDMCCNCRRVPQSLPGSAAYAACPYKLTTLVVDLHLLFARNNKRKHSFVQWARYPQNPAGEQLAKICGQCYEYLRNPSPSAPDSSAVWPGYIWGTLSNPLTSMKAWSLLPLGWKAWWLRSFALEHQKPADALNAVNSVFLERTCEVEKDLLALKNLKWAADLMPREESLALSEIKCPGGCLEWKHKANSLPLDIVWEFCLQHDTDLFTNKSKRECCNWFRRDYELHENILFNPQWQATPSVSYNRESLTPEVMCCRYHDSKCTKRMLHPCRYPGVPIATEKASQFTPVTPIPRTLRKAQASAYSPSFQIAKMEGCFVGLDTMFLSADGGYHYYQSNLAWEQEVLAYRARSEIRAYVADLCNQNILPSKIIHKFNEGSNELFPGWDEVESTFSLGANYMKLDDAVRMQQNLFFDHREELSRIPPTGNQVLPPLITFRGIWPRHLIWVHPANDPYGARMPAIPLFRSGMRKVDARSAWVLVSMIVSVPELWSEVTKAYKRPQDWEGWVLMYVTKKCFPHLALSASANNPFKVKKPYELFTQHIQTNYNEGYDPKSIASKFNPRLQQLPSYKNVIVHWDSPPRQCQDDSIMIQIVLRRKSNFGHYPAFLFPVPKGWDLRHLALSSPSAEEDNDSHWIGSVYVRHGGEHAGWWKQTQRAQRPTRLSPGWDVPELTREVLMKWTACVLVRKQPFMTSELRNMVLGACCGQTRALCCAHDTPLIVATSGQHHVCTCEPFPHLEESDSDVNPICGHPAQYVCPMIKCYSGICKDHLKRIPDASGTTVRCKPLSADEISLYSPERQTGAAPSGDAPQNAHQQQLNTDCVQNSLQGTDDLHYTEDVPCDFHETISATMQDVLPIVVPTTNAATEAILTKVKDGPFTRERMTNHALLNLYGSCLVRRNKKLNGSLSQRAFLQRLASKNYGKSLPLVYPEAMLFSDIFFAESRDHSPIGALPAAHLHSDQVLKENGFCGLLDTYRTRLTNPALLASSNPKYHFWIFDVLANFSLRGNDSRVVLRRGFAEKQGTGGVCFRDSKEPVFDSETVENRSVVCKLSASIGQKMPTYFYTHSLSMKTHFGMRLLWDWLMGDEIIRVHCNEELPSEIKHWRQSLIDSSGLYLLRAWMEISEIWLLYITKSPEHPAGIVDQFFARFELQDAIKESVDGTNTVQEICKGNLPHIHCLLWTTDDTKTAEGLFAACDRIRGYIEDITRPDEEEEYLRQSIFKSKEDILDFKETMSRFLKHEHRRRCFVLHKDNQTGQATLRRVCKAPNNWSYTSASGEHCFRSVPTEHTQEAIQVMIDIGVCSAGKSTLSEGQLFEFIPIVDFLVAEKHIPPCRGDEGLISPVLGALVAINPNSDNCQIANTYFVARYLAKYVVKIDEYCVVQLRPPPQEPDKSTFTAEPEQLLNTKITGNKIAQEEKLNRGHSDKKRNALGINIAQVYMMVFGYPSVYTNLSHVKFSTSLYGHRAARERRKPLDRLVAHNETLQNQALTPLNTIPAHHARKTCQGIEPWRQFTETQVLKAFDDLNSPLSPDSVTRFGFRPPELHWIMHQSNYHRWIQAETPVREMQLNGRTISRQVTSLPDLLLHCSAKVNSSNALERSLWISADSKHLKMRALAIDEMLAYLRVATDDSFPQSTTIPGQPRRLITSLFKTIKSSIIFKKTGTVPEPLQPTDEIKGMLSSICRDFVCCLNDTHLPTPWTHSPKPTETHRFLVHLLLRFGSFVDEYSLFQVGPLRNAFVKAKLLDLQNPQESARRLFKQYFHRELRVLPSGTPTFDKYCVAAKNAIDHFFLHGTLHSCEIPSVLYCRLRQNTTAASLAYAHQRTKDLVLNILARLEEAGFRSLPSASECLLATRQNPLSWDPTTLDRPRSQPQASFSEQLGVLTRIKEQIQTYIMAVSSTPNGVCIVGGGGVGKTTCALIGILYARCQGLNVSATALVSERAQELGTIHLNNDYAMPRASLSQITPGQLAERTIGALYRNPEKLEYHRTIDIELIDEMGPIAAEIFSARDIVLRYIRNSSKPNGGKLDLMTFDHLQMHPISGTHPLLSPLLTTVTSFMNLECSVRAAESLEWQRVQAITRMFPHELEEQAIEDEFINLLTSHCTFVPNEDQIDPSVLFVYGRNEPIRQRQAKLYASLSRRNDVLCSHSKDWECMREGRFKPGTPKLAKALNKALREQDRIYFFPGARYRITFNKPNCFSNGQLAFLATMPTKSQIARRQPITLLVSPPGSTYLPTSTDTEASLLARDWRPTKVGVAPDLMVHLSRSKAKRTEQYGLQLYVGSTWHSTMGKTLARLATKVDNSHGRNGAYSIWDPTQVVIMLSRTKLPKDTIFVSTDPIQTARTIFSVLRRTSPFRVYISYLLRQLCSCSPYDTVPILDRRRSIYRPQDVLIPSDMSGFVYALVSTRDTSFVYIGSCQNLLIRYENHNSGYGALQTAPPTLRPWGLLAFVSGFQNNRTLYESFENAWIAAKNRQAAGMVSIRSLLDDGEYLSEDFGMRHSLNLVFHQAGGLQSSNQEVLVTSSSDEERSALLVQDNVSAAEIEESLGASDDDSGYIPDDASSIGSETSHEPSEPGPSPSEQEPDGDTDTSDLDEASVQDL